MEFRVFAMPTRERFWALGALRSRPARRVRRADEVKDVRLWAVWRRLWAWKSWRWIVCAGLRMPGVCEVSELGDLSCLDATIRLSLDGLDGGFWRCKRLC